MTKGLYHGNILQQDKVAFVTHVYVALKDLVVDNFLLELSISQVMAKHCKNV